MNYSHIRGYRNNNPFNIKKSALNWQGKIEGSDKVFETFKSLDYGYRAGLKLLINYVHKGYNTIDKIVTRFAPSNENNTDVYIRFVSGRTGIPCDSPIESLIELLDIAAAIVKYECGVFVYNGIPEAGSVILFNIYKKFNLKL